jgi:hypothetical protein
VTADNQDDHSNLPEQSNAPESEPEDHRPKTVREALARGALAFRVLAAHVGQTSHSTSVKSMLGRDGSENVR